MGIISTFTIAEYIGVIRETLCNKRDGPVSDQEIEKIKQQLETFLVGMGITLYDADSVTRRMALFDECERIVEGSTSFKGKRDRKWHCVKGADALHIAFALSTNAEALATFDDDFRGASKLISPIILSEVY